MTDSKKEKILVVEDNLMSFKLVSAHFSRTNLEAVHAKNGKEALDLFNSKKDIRLIIMDIQLPGISGLEVTRSIRKVDPDIPIIAATANVFEDDKIACLEAGCNDFITKPINFKQLFKIIDNYI